MKAFLRTLWKDMVILRWWLLVWTAAVAGFAVWRDHLAAQWDASSFDSKLDADTVQKVLLGFAAVFAVRLMHTDKLHGDFAFWRTRPTSALRLAFAKLVLGFLWLFLLPVAVELALLYHWGWQDWCAPCIATWAIALGAVLVPAFCAAAFIPAASISMPVALLLAWFSFNQRPGAHSDWMSLTGTLAPAFWSFYTRTLLGCLATLCAAAARWWMAVGLVVLMFVPFPKMDWVRLPARLDPTSPARTDEPAPIVLESSTYADRVYLRFPDTKQPVWAGNSGQPIILTPEDGSDPISYSPDYPFEIWTTERYERVVSAERFSNWPGGDFWCLFLNQNRGWGQVQPIPYPSFKSEKRGRITSPIIYGTFDDPISGELPLVKGSSWHRGPFRITLIGIGTSKYGPAFRLRFEMPHSRAGQWRASLHGTGCSTNIHIGLINRRLGLFLKANVSRGLSRDYQEHDAIPVMEANTLSTSLYRQSFEHTLYPSLWNLDYYVRGAKELDGDVFRDALIVFGEWSVTTRGETVLSREEWPPKPPVDWARDDYAKEAKAYEELKSLPIPVANDDAAVTRYIDDLIRLRRQIEGGHGLHRPVPAFATSQFTSLGSKWLPHIIRRLTVNLPGGTGGYDHPTKGERSEWIDILAAQMAVPEHGPLLLELMRGGLPLHRTILAHEWFRRLATPELAQIAAMFDLGGVWLSVMVELNDPALNPAIIAWFRCGYVGDRLHRAPYLWDKPGFPCAEVLEVLTARRSEMLPGALVAFNLLRAIGGVTEGMRELPPLLSDESWKKVVETSLFPYGDTFQKLLPLLADGPAEPGKVVDWIIANGSKLRWTGAQWVLPPAK